MKFKTIPILQRLRHYKTAKVSLIISYNSN